MRELAFLLALLFCFSACFISVTNVFVSDTMLSDIETSSAFILPTSLKEIGKSAFEGTTVEKVILPDSTTIIRERAFAENSSLKMIRISELVEYIGDSSFDGSINVTIVVMAGSYAANWARTHNVAFTLENNAFTWLTKLIKLLHESFLIAFSPLCLCPCAKMLRQRKEMKYVKSMRPQDRPELYPVDYRFP